MPTRDAPTGLRGKVLGEEEKEEKEEEAEAPPVPGTNSNE
jgi:hypothetical protein